MGLYYRRQEGSQVFHGSFNDDDNDPTRIAFVGNSMFYFNDFPRFFQALAAYSSQSIVQQSCLHGGASIPSLLMNGNGMYNQFGTPSSIITHMDNNTIYDYGACTVSQLLLGTDERLDDPGYINFKEKIGNTSQTNQNPCRVDSHYMSYAKEYFQTEISGDMDYWDYVFINDNTRDPARFATRAHSLQFLESFYVPIFQTMNHSVPIFLWTHAYSVESTKERNMTGLQDVANFTSLTGVGYRNYVKLLSQFLPPSRTPRIAPVGLGFLMVYEERPDLWIQLFHNADHIHASPSGSYLQGCIVYHTIFGQMPPRIRPHDDTRHLWKHVRMMQHAWEPPNPYPTREMTDYLYNVAQRIMVHGELPKTYIEYADDVVAYEGEGRPKMVVGTRIKDENHSHYT